MPKNNKRRFLTHDSRTLSIGEWSKATGISRLTIHNRIERGWSVEDALTTPVHKTSEMPFNERRKQRRTTRRSEGMCPECGADAGGRYLCKLCLSKYKAYRAANPETWKASQRKSNIKVKKMVFAVYGTACVCCTEKRLQFLTIDHINDDGAEHRRCIGVTGTNFYRWLIKREFPRDGFRTLCFNCNLGRRINGGICPHEAERMNSNECSQRSVPLLE